MNKDIIRTGQWIMGVLMALGLGHMVLGIVAHVFVIGS